MAKTIEYRLRGVEGLCLAEYVLVGNPCVGRSPQRRPLVLTLEEDIFLWQAVDREIERLRNVRREAGRKRRLEMLETLKKKFYKV